METSNFLGRITRFWWVPLITGLVFVGFGIWCLCDPTASLSLLAYFFAGAIGLIGIFNLIFGLTNIDTNGGWALAGGIIEILFSIFLFFIPQPALTTIFIYGTGIYILFMTVYGFCESFMMSRYSNSVLSWILFFFLLVAFVFACIYILGPIGGGILIWLYIGISFIGYGIFRILLSARICEVNKILNKRDY